MLRARHIVCVSGLAMVVAACQPSSNSRLDELIAQSMSTEAGRGYAQTAIVTFWGNDIQRFWQCIPANDSVTAFVEIKPDGNIGELVVSPESAASACVIKQAQGRVFPKPPLARPYAIKVTLKRDA